MSLVACTFIGSTLQLNPDKAARIRVHISDFRNRKEKRGEYFETETMMAHGYPWKIRIYPRGRIRSGSDNVADNVKWVSCFLICASDAHDRKEFPVDAKAIFRVNNSYEVTVPMDGEDKGISNWLHWNDACKEEVLTIEIDISVDKQRKSIWYPTKARKDTSDWKFRKLHSSSKSSDVTFIVGTKQRKFNCHKCILEMSSPYLYGLVLSKAEEIDDIDTAAAKSEIAEQKKSEQEGISFEGFVPVSSVEENHDDDKGDDDKEEEENKDAPVRSTKNMPSSFLSSAPCPPKTPFGTTAIGAGGFSFGGKSNTTSTSSSGGFKFGTTSNVTSDDALPLMPSKAPTLSRGIKPAGNAPASTFAALPPMSSKAPSPFGMSSKAPSPFGGAKTPKPAEQAPASTFAALPPMSSKAPSPFGGAKTPKPAEQAPASTFAALPTMSSKAPSPFGGAKTSKPAEQAPASTFAALPTMSSKAPSPFGGAKTSKPAEQAPASTFAALPPMSSKAPSPFGAFGVKPSKLAEKVPASTFAALPPMSSKAPSPFGAFGVKPSKPAEKVPASTFAVLPPIRTTSNSSAKNTALASGLFGGVLNSGKQNTTQFSDLPPSVFGGGGGGGSTSMAKAPTPFSTFIKPSESLFGRTSSSPSNVNIELPGVDEVAFEALFKFLYTGIEPNDIRGDENSAVEMLVLANQFDCTHLKLYAESVLAERFLDTSNAADKLLFADAHSCALLKEAAMGMYATDPRSVKKTEGYSKLMKSKDLVIELLEYISGERGEYIRVIDCTPEEDVDNLDVTSLRERLQSVRIQDVDGSKEMLVKRWKDTIV
jgi:hypothetical protein